MKLSGIAKSRPGLLRRVGAGLHVVGGLRPVAVELAVLQHPALQHGVEARLLRDRARRQLPDLLGDRAVLRVHHHHVGRQAVREHADLARGAARRGLAGEGERAVARRGDLAGEQMQVVDHVVRPHAARVLVEPHGPERHHLDLRVGVELRQAAQPVGRQARELGHRVHVVLRDELRELVEADRLEAAGIGGVLRLFLQRVLGPQAVADVVVAQAERDVLGYEVAVHGVVLNDVVGDVIQDREVGLRPEGERQVGELVAAMLESGEHRHLHVRVAEAPVRDPSPQDRVHLRHVRAPQHEGIGMLDVVVAAHRLVDAEGAHEGDRGARHAVARVGIDVVGAKAGLHQLDRGVALPDGRLAGHEHADRGRALLLQRRLPLLAP